MSSTLSIHLKASTDSYEMAYSSSIKLIYSEKLLGNRLLAHISHYLYIKLFHSHINYDPFKNFAIFPQYETEVWCSHLQKKKKYCESMSAFKQNILLIIGFTLIFYTYSINLKTEKKKFPYSQNKGFWRIYFGNFMRCLKSI